MTKLERKKSCSATAEEFESDVCNLNCLAFLHLKRQTLNRAKPIVAEVLAKDPQNITALANQCELLLLSYDFKKAAEVLGELEAQRDNEGANAMALAEQGYFLSRMGPRVYLQAIEKFEQAIEKGRGHCSQDKIIFWHYNIALNYDSESFNKCAEPLLLLEGQEGIFPTKRINPGVVGLPILYYASHNPLNRHGIVRWESWGRVCQNGAGRS
ncbi:unnamed protein product [Lampetra fluviatilis]